MRQFWCKFDTVFGAIAMPSKERNHFLFKKLPSYKTYRLEGAIRNCTLQMFKGNYRDSTGKSECRDFKFMGIACIPAIPVILKSLHSDFHYNICKEFDFTGILRGFPALDVGKTL